MKLTQNDLLVVNAEKDVRISQLENVLMDLQKKNAELEAEIKVLKAPKKDKKSN